MEFLLISRSHATLLIMKFSLVNLSIMVYEVFLINDLYHPTRFSHVHLCIDDANLLDINKSPKMLNKILNYHLKLETCQIGKPTKLL